MTRTIVESKTRTTIIGFDQPFAVIGERINPTGRKILNEELERGDFSRVEADALAQVAAGANILDINSGAVFSNKMAEDPRYADNNFVEPTLMRSLIERVQAVVDTPLCIDSSVPGALLAGLEAAEGRPLLARLLAQDDWLPEAFAAVRPDRYAQYLLHCDPLERFCVVSFVWGPGHGTPVHDHTVWGLVGILRGAERCEEFTLQAGQPVATGGQHLMQRGDIEAVSPRVGDWHSVSHAGGDAATVSIHVYGANIGAVARHIFDPASGTAKAFVSGYSSPLMPNFWDRSAAVRASLTQ